MFPSLRDGASEILEVSKDIVPRYLNNVQYFMSPSLGVKVRVQESNAVLIYDKIEHRAQIYHPLLNYNFKSLKVGKIFTLLLDKVTIHSS